KSSAGIASFTWDIDELRKDGGWRLIDGKPSLPVGSLSRLRGRKTGTLVVWRKVDFGRKNDRPTQAAFMKDLERVDLHLGMVFHRFIAGDARRISIKLNGHQINAWDPFLESHESTIRNPEQHIDGPGGRIRVRGFVLPHRDRFRN